MIKETICYYLSGDIAEGGYNKKVTNSDIQRGSLNFCIFAVTWFLKGLYSDFGLSIIPNDFHTKYIAVEKGVLQGDSFSPLTFNLIINTFLHCVKEEKFTNFGYRTFKSFLQLVSFRGWHCSSNFFRKWKSGFIKSIQQIAEMIRNDN